MRYLYFHAVAAIADARLDARFGVEEQGQALTDVLERHAVAGAVLLLLDVRILDAREHAIAAPLDAHCTSPAPVPGSTPGDTAFSSRRRSTHGGQQAFRRPPTDSPGKGRPPPGAHRPRPANPPG